MRKNKHSERLSLPYDESDSYIKIPLFEGESYFLPITDGSVSIGEKSFLISFNLLDGSVIKATLIKSRCPEYEDTLVITDILRYGSNDLSPISYRARFEYLDLICTSLSEDYGFRMFGSRCISPYVYIVHPVNGRECLSTQDPRVIGFEAIHKTDLSDRTQVLKSEVDDEDCTADNVMDFPPVENEEARVLAYKPLIRMMIKKISGKWKDAGYVRHQPSCLPYDAEDLMQFGLLQTLIAIRRYNYDNPWDAKEKTFIFRHLWNRFGQIAHKYSKSSKGYGIRHVYDSEDENGNFVSAYDHIK